MESQLTFPTSDTGSSWNGMFPPVFQRATGLNYYDIRVLHSTAGVAIIPPFPVYTKENQLITSLVEVCKHKTILVQLLYIYINLNFDSLIDLLLGNLAVDLLYMC